MNIMTGVCVLSGSTSISSGSEHGHQPDQNRNYKFIIYMDDLSFEEFEIEYKYLKAVIEGGLEKKPENVTIYAT